MLFKKKVSLQLTSPSEFAMKNICQGRMFEYLSSSKAVKNTGNIKEALLQP